MSRRRLKTILKNVPQGSLPVLFGTATAQASLLLAAPVLTRLYPAAEFGAFATFLAVTSILTVGASLRFDLAVMLPRDDRSVSAIAWLGIGALMTMSLSVAALLPIFDGSLPSWWFVLMPASIALRGLNQMLQALLNRHRLVHLLATGRLATALGTVAGQIIIGLHEGLAVGLAGGYILGQAIGSVICASGALSPLFCTGRLRWRRLRAAAGRYRRFPLLDTPAALLNVAGKELPLILIAALLSDASAGLFAIAIRVMLFPAGLVTMSVGQMFFRDAAALQRAGGDVRQAARRLLGTVATIGGVGYLFAGVGSPWLFPIVFGHEWGEAGIIALLLTPLGFLTFMGAPLSQIFAVVERQDLFLGFQAASLVIAVASIIAGSSLGDLRLAVALYSALEATRYGLMIVVILRLCPTATVQNEA